jgi:phosphatidate cytidylyltransferase
MDHERRSDPEDKRKDPPSEGVRIIGAEEAAEALERGDVAQRRPGDQPRFGDRPEAPGGDGPRPVLRFPLGSSSDPRDIERPAVASPGPISEQVELPHWTEPPTGQVPQILPEAPADDAADDLDDWASFASSTPRWRDDLSRREPEEGFDDVAAWGPDDDDARLGALDDSERPTHDDYFSFADLDDTVVPGRSVFADDPEPGFGSDWADEPEDVALADDVEEELVPYDEPRRRRAAAPRPRREPEEPPRPRRAASGGPDRDMGTAVVVGVGFLVVALVLFKIGPAAAMILVSAIIGLAAAELFGVLRQAGYQPVALAGIVGSVGAVIGAYNYGTAAIPTVLFLTTAVCLLWYLVGAAHESPVMNVGVTLLGVLWVGLFGSFAGLMLSLGDDGIGILLATVLGTVGYDVGGLFIGKNAGRQPLSAASPNKTVEGLLGGCVVGFVVVVLLSAVFGLGPIDSFAEGALVGLAIALAAPLGDLCESLVKRDLGVKDMGSILPGHGGLLDRFDGLLFALPAVYLLASVRDFFL